MTWPTTPIDTTQADAGTDSPASWRAAALALSQSFNTLIAHVSTYMQGLLASASAADARTNLGATAVGASLFTTTDAAAARTTLGVLSVQQTKSVPVNTTGLESGECFVTATGLTLATGLTAGNTYVIFNDSAAAITLTQGAGLTLRAAGTTLTGNRTLNPRGLCTLWARSATEYVISGAGLV